MDSFTMLRWPHHDILVESYTCCFKLGAFFCPRRGQKNRAFRCKSSEAPMRFLWAFRSNPWRMAAANIKP
ncbi:MAG: hypothetical protein LBK44_01710 [Spirochaetales bacterium]|nr:hypothetical protein [Spirochaetales bacterium]